MCRALLYLTHWPLGDFNLIYVGNFQAYFKVNGGWGISFEIALRWMPLDLTDDKSTLVQVMAWCRQATSHYLSQRWPRSMSPNGVTRPQWLNFHLVILVLWFLWHIYLYSSGLFTWHLHYFFFLHTNSDHKVQLVYRGLSGSLSN